LISHETDDEDGSLCVYYCISLLNEIQYYETLNFGEYSLFSAADFFRPDLARVSRFYRERSNYMKCTVMHSLYRILQITVW